MAKTGDLEQKDLEKGLEKDLDDSIPNLTPNDLQVFGLAHVLSCLVKIYDAGGFGLNWEKNTLTREMIFESKEYLEQFPICEKKIKEIDSLISSVRKYQTRKKKS